jgi:hypothetical protein
MSSYMVHTDDKIFPDPFIINPDRLDWERKAVRHIFGLVFQRWQTMHGNKVSCSFLDFCKFR